MTAILLGIIGCLIFTIGFIVYKVIRYIDSLKGFK